MRGFFRQTRARLAAAYAVVFTVVAMIAAAGFWLAFQQAEYAAVDSSLSAQAQALVAGLDQSGGRITFQGTDTLPGETSEGIAIAAVLLRSDGTIIDRSGQDTAVVDLMPLVRQASATGRPLVVSKIAGGHRERLLAESVTLGPAGAATLVVSRTLGELDATLARTAIFLGLGVVVLALTASVAGYGLAARALRPVRQIAATARDISEQDLHRRVDLGLPADELGELADTFNGMLARLEEAFDTLRRFTSDAAHDLRAPLAILLLEVDVALDQPHTPAEYGDSLRVVQVEARRLSRMVEQLLLLARDDAGALHPQRQELDVSDILEEAASRWRPLAQEGGVRVVTELPPDGTLSADPDLLQRLLDNLIDNAIRYTPRGGVVELLCLRSSEDWEIEVRDSGPGIPVSLRPTLFDRFTRADEARGRETGGAGLGLSLCAVIARLHRGTIVLGQSANGTRMVVRLPAR